MTRMARLTVPLAVIAALALACRGTDGPTGPAPTRLASGVATMNHGTSPVGDDIVFVVKRQSPLSGNVTASGTIGAAGGEIRIPSAGLRVTFPPGAVRTPTLITLTANSGGDASYEFQPHGIHFAVPVTVEQDVRYTIASRFPELEDKLRGSYYEGNLNDDYVDAQHRFAHVKEVHTGTVNHAAHTFTFSISHFSGWVICTGRSDAIDW